MNFTEEHLNKVAEQQRAARDKGEKSILTERPRTASSVAQNHTNLAESVQMPGSKTNQLPRNLDITNNLSMIIMNKLSSTVGESSNALESVLKGITSELFAMDQKTELCKY